MSLLSLIPSLSVSASRRSVSNPSSSYTLLPLRSSSASLRPSLSSSVSTPKSQNPSSSVSSGRLVSSSGSEPHLISSILLNPSASSSGSPWSQSPSPSRSNPSLLVLGEPSIAQSLQPSSSSSSQHCYVCSSLTNLVRELIPCKPQEPHIASCY